MSCSAAAASASRSARRQTVRATCRRAAASVPPGQDEAAQLRQSSALKRSQSRSSRRPAPGSRAAAPRCPNGTREVGAEVEELVLDARERLARCSAGQSPGERRQPELRVQLVTVAVGGDPRSRASRRASRRRARSRRRRRRACRSASGEPARRSRAAWPEPTRDWSQPEDAAGDHQALHLARALVDLGDLRVPVVALDGELLRVAVAAEDLDRLGGLRAAPSRRRRASPSRPPPCAAGPAA